MADSKCLLTSKKTGSGAVEVLPLKLTGDKSQGVAEAAVVCFYAVVENSKLHAVVVLRLAGLGIEPRSCLRAGSPAALCSARTLALLETSGKRTCTSSREAGFASASKENFVHVASLQCFELHATAKLGT
eukprot:scaffold228283_cov18-Prasinocladus_malaysianus.AAC.1